VTVGKWRQRFLESGLDGLVDAPRPGTPRTITDEDAERVIAKTLEEMPQNATQWSTRSMADATGMSQSAISRCCWPSHPQLYPQQLGRETSPLDANRGAKRRAMGTDDASASPTK
jgi:hypothetical protein